MVGNASRIDWTIVNSEFEALQLEFTWIKEFNPPFNVQFKDDKSYPYLVISIQEDFPRAFSSRRRTKDGAKYFGPYTQAWAVRETIDTLLKVFPIRTCNTSVFDNAKRTGRPCLLAEIGKCAAPCVGRVTAEEHRKIAKGFADFVSGSAGSLIKNLKAEMLVASDQLNFEKAGRLRDQVGALEAVNAKSAVVFEDNTSADLFAIAIDDFSAGISMFKVRDGRIRGARGWVVDLEIERTPEELLEYALQNNYDADDDVPKEILIPWAPADEVELAGWLSGKAGVQVKLRVPQRGDKKSLADTALTNAKHSLLNYKLKRSTDFTARSTALANLQAALGLEAPPLTIECFDVSHLAGTGIVASKVVFVDGLPKKDLYRRFNIADSTDDTESMRQVITRRCMQLLVGDKESLPLIVVDGGLPQVNAARNAARAAGLPHLRIIGLAKRLEEVWTDTSNFPLILPRASDELYLLQALRDEAHRFAIGHQRLKRKATISSKLEEIEGVGVAKVRLLLKHFGSAKRVAAATIDELSDVPGIGPVLAVQIHSAFVKN
jgi:excinuclease ABC subunit C